ncbi:RNA polymerase sigma factor [Agathobaculum sp. Marseille-P7918]|uniref:RNA polymerase sigma factor n=1 Tax=Agathobaculum sp. Marseille-P7918 TaxID=2479843 RepID=UPI000F6424A1|nr:RNA polymerase sigma factor [Agathobaculum sp. Marseille-P7918]
MTDKTPEQLIRTYGATVYRLAYAQTRSRHDADDIFQEVFLRVTQHHPVFDSEAHEKAWLLRVTLNCLKSHWRAAWRRHDVPLDERIPFPAPEENALDEALRQLAPKYRAAVHLFYFEGYSAEEIARMTGEKPSAIRTRLTRARAQLRDLLKGEDDDEL